MALRQLTKVVVATAAILGIAGGSQQKPLHEQAPTGKDTHNPLTPEFAEYVAGLLEDWKVPGMSIAVLDGDELYAEGYGFSTLPNTRATPETLWLGGSTTKAYVAATLAHLIDSENYTALSSGWSTPISSILPDDFVLKEEWSTKHITLEDAASHRTGMSRHDFSWARSVNDKPVTNKDNVRNLRNLPPTAQPRTVFQYCNLMYLTLSHVVETLTGNRVDDVINKVIWTPLEMNNTYMDLEAAKDNPNPMATGYFWDDSKDGYTAIPEDPVQHSSGAGAIISNVLDYAKWVKCLLDEAAPFSKKTHRDIRTPRMLETSMPTSGFDVDLYGLGWERTIFHGEVLYKHGGTTAAFSANIYWMPDLKYAIVSFSNVAGIENSVEEIVSRKLVEDKLQVPQRDRVDYGQERKQLIEKKIRDLKNAVDILYPNRPEEPSDPSRVHFSEYAGTYHDAGYGTIVLDVQSDSETQQEVGLVALQEESISPIRLEMRHVYDDKWIVYASAVSAASYSRSFHAAEFQLGNDGKVSGLRITWSKADGVIDAVKTLFARVD